MKRVHLMGIGGVGMAGVAFLLHRRGCEVSGCDCRPSPRTRWLEANGIAVAVGHDPAHLEGADALVVTPAVRRDEPELVRARELGLEIRARGEVLAGIVSAGDSVAVCGSHGKTTTATFAAKLLRALGEDPSWAIGGETGDFPVAGCGSGPLVAEADESDGTLALYRARTLVITNIDYDHPEHFKSVGEYRACYDRAAAGAGDVIRAWELDAGDFPELPSLVAGRHNVANARAAIEVALRRGHSAAAVRAVLPQVLSRLPDRRFQRIWPAADGGDPGGARVYTDYAHHPREIACALAMGREAAGSGRLRVLFQPHRYTRTAALLRDFPPALAAAGELVLIPVYAAFEEPVAGGDIADLYAACRAASSRESAPLLARSAREAWRHVFLTRRPGDLVLLLGAGDLVDLVPEILATMADPARPADAVVRFLGAGSNTWRSDLATDERYVGTSGPAGLPGASLGIPWMAGIPGTVGGWTAMNAGAFGHSIGELVEAVTVRRADGSFADLPASRCGFGYRTSSIPGEIYAVRFDAAALAEARASGSAEDFLARRRRFPAGTRGSVFKNPPGDYAGRLLEAAGAGKLRVGGASVWSEHANVIVSGPEATASDFLALARLMARAVRFRFGVRLEPEVRGLAVW